MSSPFDAFVLINLEGASDVSFRRFPTGIETSVRVNWQAQDVTVGTKPLYFANREPRQLRFDDLLLDSTETGESITPEIDSLMMLTQEVEGLGRPPVLLAQWGDRQERCVLADATISEQFFLGDGTPIRARVSLTLLQFQDDAPPATSRRVRENEEANILF
ncbi:MAG: hypothetical protein ABW250_08995 [Pyrinomonadaceae bacterium]